MTYGNVIHRPLPSLSALVPFPEDARRQWHACLYPGCNAIFEASTTSEEVKLCEKHRLPRGFRMHADNGGKQTTRYAKSYAWEVVFDPVPRDCGGFLKGAQFLHQEFEAMLNVETAMPGLQVRYHGTVYTVVRKNNQGAITYYLRSGNKLLTFKQVTEGGED